MFWNVYCSTGRIEMRLVQRNDLDEHCHQRRTYEELKEMGDCHVAVENYSEAERCYRQAAVLAPNEAGPFVGLGVVAMQTDRHDEAMRVFQTASMISPDCSEAYSGMAMIHQERGKFPQAFEMYLHCLELDSNNLMALLGLFQTSCQMGTFSKIIHYLERYLDTHPSDHSVLFCLATLYAREGHLIQAKQAVLAVLAGDTNKLEARQLLEDIDAKLDRNRMQEVA